MTVMYYRVKRLNLGIVAACNIDCFFNVPGLKFFSLPRDATF